MRYKIRLLKIAFSYACAAEFALSKATAMPPIKARMGAFDTTKLETETAAPLIAVPRPSVAPSAAVSPAAKPAAETAASFCAADKEALETTAFCAHAGISFIAEAAALKSFVPASRPSKDDTISPIFFNDDVCYNSIIMEGDLNGISKMHRMQQSGF